MAQLSLDDIAKRIDEFEVQLKNLRSDYVARNSELSRLQQQKKELQTQLRQVDGQIDHLQRGGGAAAAAAVSAPSKPKAKGGAAKKSKKKKAKASAAPAKRTRQTTDQRPLRDYVNDILRVAKKPLKTREIADRALAAGYQTNSKNFPAVVQDMLKRMDNLERIPNQGYQFNRS